MQKFINAVNTISEWSGKLTGFLIIPLILIIVYTSLMRYVFHHSINWGFEISIFVFGTHFMLGGAYCLLLDSHVTVDIIPNRLPFTLQKLSQILGRVVVLLACFMMVWLGSSWAWKSTMIWERSIHQTAFNPPIWWFKWILPLSAALLGLQALADALQRIMEMVSKDKGE